MFQLPNQGGAGVASGALCALVVSSVLASSQPFDRLSLEARTLRQSIGSEVVKTISPEHVTAGAVIPKETHVIFQMPLDAADTPREILLGQQGTTVRYWGYCGKSGTAFFPPAKGIVPSRLFLSEKERTTRAAKRKRALVLRSPEDQATAAPDIMLHTTDIFRAGDTCYIMSEEALPLGFDTDGDFLNDQLERRLGTNVTFQDTDGDTISDDVEYFYLGTNPTLQDTDSDGLPDNEEDRNGNAKIDADETSPISLDTDRDGLCDGWCTKEIGFVCNMKLYTSCMYIDSMQMGEDRNLNGVLDAGETDPLKYQTDGKISDYQRLINCILATGSGGTTNC